MEVNILGTDYEIKYETRMENPKLINANGLCEFWAKQIIIDKIEPDPENYKNITEFEKKVIRHEIIHAFLGESGLRQYMEDETLVDWIAVQFHKIEEIFKELKV